MSETTPKKAPRKPSARSRVTNGKLGDMDGRGKWARRLADLIDLYSADLADDPAQLPYYVQSLVRRAATLTVELERAEANSAKDGQTKATDFDAYQRATNTLARLLGQLQTKMGIVEHIVRPMPPREAMNQGGVFLRRRGSAAIDHTAGFSTADWRLCHGDVIPREADRRLARAIAFRVNQAAAEGEPIPTSFEQFATLLGYETEDTEGNVIDLESYRHSETQEAPREGGETSADD